MSIYLYYDHSVSTVFAGMLRYDFETGRRGLLGFQPIVSRGESRLTAPPVQEVGRKHPITGYSGFVPGYTSESFNYGKVWKDIVVGNERRKDDGVANWGEENLCTTNQKACEIADRRMKEVWKQEDETSEDRDKRWTVHEITRSRDKDIVSSSYKGHIPNIRTENLVGASFYKTIKAAAKLRDPYVQIHITGEASPFKAVEAYSELRAGWSRNLSMSKRATAEAAGAQGHWQSLRLPSTNDATGRAPAHLQSSLRKETPWSLDEDRDWRHTSHRLHGLVVKPSSPDPLARKAAESPPDWTGRSYLDTMSRSVSIMETPPSQRLALRPLVLNLRGGAAPPAAATARARLGSATWGPAPASAALSPPLSPPDAGGA